KGRDLFILGINYNNSHYKIMDFNKSEDFLLFVDNNHRIFNINKLIKNKNVVISINYHDIENTTQLSISEEIPSTKSIHTIDLVGNFTFDDIFNS
ncbi:hypothetical protein, partial [Proteus columbae]